jgi:hypothetical protein
MNMGPSELQKAIARALHGYDNNEDEDEPEMSDNSSDEVEENNDDTWYVIL